MHLATAYKNFFDSRKGKRKGVKIGLPKFKKKTNNQSAEFAKNPHSADIQAEVKEDRFGN